MKDTIKRIISITLVLGMIICLCSCGKSEDNASSDTEETTSYERVEYEEPADKVVKTETVYVNMSDNGTVSSITVSDWLHTDKGSVHVNDRSDLNDIVNVKGRELPLVTGTDLRWDMASTDLYYRGYSSKELPVGINIAYKVNDIQTKAEDLVDVNGKITMDFTVTNRNKKTVSIGGKDVEIYEPVVLIGGMILDESQFSAIETVNGKTIGDGSKEIAVFISLPGLSESLGISEEALSTISNDVLSGINLSGNFGITMQADRFTLGNMYFVAMPISSFKGSLQADETISEVSGLLTSVKEIADTVYSMGANDLIEYLMTNSDKVSQFADAFSEARDIYNSNKVLVDAIKKNLTPETVSALKTVIADVNTIDLNSYYEMLSDEEVQKVLAGISDTDFSKYEQLLSNPLFKTFFKDLASLGGDLETLEPLLKQVMNDEEKFSTLLTDFEALMPSIEALSASLSTPEAKAAIANLPATFTRIQSVVNLLSANKDLIEKLSTTFSEENINKLTNALNSSGDIDVDRLMASVSSLTINPDETIARLKALNEFAKENTIYTMAGDNMETSVMYVFRSDSIG